MTRGVSRDITPPMIFRQLFDATSSTFTYVLADPVERRAIVIDPVFEQHRRDLAMLRELELSLAWVLETHVHADHVTGAWLLREATGCEVAVGRAAGATGADRLLEHGDRITVGSLVLDVRATPGHTGGCLTYVTGDQRMAFTGDALLIRGAGRTDFQEGSASRLYRSIQEQIFTLPGGCLLYPAHDYAGRTVSTVEEESRWNPRVGGSASVEDFVGYMDNLHLPHPKKLDVAVPANLKLGEPESGARPPEVSWAPVLRSFANVPELDAGWVHEHLTEITVLDVREDRERTGELGSIPGSLHVPLGALGERLEDVPGGPVVVVCRSGRRSARGAQILEGRGREEVANLTGGMLEWNARGYPTTSG